MLTWVSGLGESRVDEAFMFKEFGSDYPVVDKYGAIVFHGGKAPDEKYALKQNSKALYKIYWVEKVKNHSQSITHKVILNVMFCFRNQNKES